MRVRAGETLRISDGRIDHQITHSMADEIASGIFGPRNPTTLMQVPELAWSNVQDEMDAVLASVFKTMARSGEELRARTARVPRFSGKGLLDKRLLDS